MRGEQAIFNLEIKKKSGLSINPDIQHSKVFSSDNLRRMNHFESLNSKFLGENARFFEYYGFFCR